MKKFLLVAFVAIATMVTSCKKDENNSIEGTWQIESATLDGEAATLDECRKESVITFTSNMFISINYYTDFDNFDEKCIPSSAVKALYAIEGDKLVIMKDNKTERITFNVSGDTLTFTFSDEDGKIGTTVYKRK